MDELFEVAVARLRAKNDPKASKIADDLEAMDHVMLAFTGDEEHKPTLKWHNAAAQLLATLMVDMENFQVLATMERLQDNIGEMASALQVIKQKNYELAFVMGYELGQGEYDIDQCTVDHVDEEQHAE